MAIGERDSEPSDDPSRSRSARVRALDVASEQLGLVGRSDTVEQQEDGTLVIVEHKATPVRRSTTVTAATRVQLALLGLCLEEMGYSISGYAVWFSTHRTRVDVVVGEPERAAAKAAVEATRSTVGSAQAPPPLEDDPRCRSCSHVDVCLPDERDLGPVRRRLARDPDGQVLHLATPGSRAGLRKGRVRVAREGEELGSVPLERVDALVIHGNVDVSSALIRELLMRSVPLLWASGRGRLAGWAGSARSPNGGTRNLQHLASAFGRVDLAKEMVAAKIANQATLLRRHGDAAAIVTRLRELSRQAQGAESVARLYGLEGEAARGYFAEFGALLSARVRQDEGVSFEARTRRPAQDPVNAALNLAYGLIACGLDPHAGFLHSSNRNKPALALDLVEEFRPAVGDSVVLSAFNNGEVGASDFSSVLSTCRLREGGRRALIAAYERRMATEFRHPLFGYQVTWRRAVEIQARQVLGVLDGSQPRYAAVRIR
jgi:CRISPR-associated protein Cas1